MESRVEVLIAQPSGAILRMVTDDMTGDSDTRRGYRHEATGIVTAADPEAPIAPYEMRLRGQRATVRKGVLGPDGRWWWAPQCTGRLTRSVPVGTGWQIRICSPEIMIDWSGFARPRAIVGSAIATLRYLVAEVDRGAPVDVHPGIVDVTMPSKTYPADGGMRQAVTDATQVLGARLYTTPAGGWRIAPIPTPSDPAAWRITTENLVVDDALAGDDEDDTFNVVSVASTETDFAHIVGLAFVGDAGSRLYVGDTGMELLTGIRGTAGTEGYGVKTSYLALPLTSQTAAGVAAAARLQELTNRGSARVLTMHELPWADVDQVLHVTGPSGKASRHLITRLPRPITAGGLVTPDTVTS